MPDGLASVDEFLARVLADLRPAAPVELPLLDALGLAVSLTGRLLHGGAVDRDEGVLRRPEDAAREHQAHGDREQQPFHGPHCCLSCLRCSSAPVPLPSEEPGSAYGNHETVGRRWTR